MEEARPRVLLLVLAVLLLALGDGALRGLRTVTHPAFDRTEPASVLRSDPALLFHLTQAVVLPGHVADWRADPGPEHPGLVDDPATYTVGLEFIVAAAHKLWPSPPLLVLCAWVSSLLAALAVIGVAGIGYELTRSTRGGLLAAVIFVVLPAGHRTIAFVLMREDLALPLYAAHVWLLLRALRSRGGPSWLASGMALAAALATWHGTVVLLTLECVAGILALVLARRRPFLPRSAIVAGVALVTAAVCVPALAAKGGIAAPVVALGVGTLAAGVFAKGRLIVLTYSFAPFALAVLLSSGADDFSHVVALLFAKLRTFGLQPDDPLSLPFEARMMWQGPFATLGLSGALAAFQLVLLLLPWTLVRSLLLRGSADASEDEGRERFFALWLTLGCFAMLLVARVMVLTSVLLPGLLAVHVLRWRHPQRTRLVATMLLVQALLFGFALVAKPTDWHEPERSRAAIELVRAIERHVPGGAAIAVDFVNGPTILACTGRPVPLSPKWERAGARRNVERFWRQFHEHSPEDFRSYVRDELRCEFLVIDRRTLFSAHAARWLAGIGLEPGAGTAAEALLPEDSTRLGQVPGFRLLWSGEARVHGERQFPAWYQLYRVE